MPHPKFRTQKQDSRCQGTAYSVPLSNNSVITVSYWCETEFGSELSMVSLVWFFFFLQSWLSSRSQQISESIWVAMELQHEAFQLQHFIREKAEGRRQRFWNGQDRTECLCAHECVCVCVSLNYQNNNNNNKFVTAIPILTLLRLRVESPLPLLPVIPSKTLTEGHKAFYWTHPLSRN